MNGRCGGHCTQYDQAERCYKFALENNIKGKSWSAEYSTTYILHTLS